MNKYQKQAMMFIIKRLCILILFLIVPAVYYLTHKSEKDVYIILMIIVEVEAFFILGCYVIYMYWSDKCDDFERKDKKE